MRFELFSSFIGKLLYSLSQRVIQQQTSSVWSCYCAQGHRQAETGHGLPQTVAQCFFQILLWYFRLILRNWTIENRPRRKVHKNMPLFLSSLLGNPDTVLSGFWLLNLSLFSLLSGQHPTCDNKGGRIGGARWPGVLWFWSVQRWPEPGRWWRPGLPGRPLTYLNSIISIFIFAWLCPQLLH